MYIKNVCVADFLLYKIKYLKNPQLRTCIFNIIPQTKQEE